ncbi:hypothetical protein K438DRAFT_1943261 [Mycena galopus ATCC 62051]|nr:hypothetical protein K438DRAFT_1943261 [Mycena galopus ATCC 62051]
MLGSRLNGDRPRWSRRFLHPSWSRGLMDREVRLRGLTTSVSVLVHLEVTPASADPPDRLVGDIGTKDLRGLERFVPTRVRLDPCPGPDAAVFDPEGAGGMAADSLASRPLKVLKERSGREESTRSLRGAVLELGGDESASEPFCAGSSLGSAIDGLSPVVNVVNHFAVPMRLESRNNETHAS